MSLNISSSISHSLLPLLLSSLLFNILDFSLSDVGTATFYRSPFIPTSCYGSDASLVPSNSLFAAAGDGVWDSGASCGRQYVVRCISGAVTGSCKINPTVQVKIIDHGVRLVSPPTIKNTTLVLSIVAFARIAHPNATSINVEYQQV